MIIDVGRLLGSQCVDAIGDEHGKTLYSWVGTDLRAAKEDGESEHLGLGPIGQAVTLEEFDKVYLFSNYEKRESTAYAKWLKKRTGAKITCRQLVLKHGPTDYDGIWPALLPALTPLIVPEDETYFHLSPGTSAMAVIWVFEFGEFPTAQLLQTSLERGIDYPELPMKITPQLMERDLRFARALKEHQRTRAGRYQWI